MSDHRVSSKKAGSDSCLSFRRWYSWFPLAEDMYYELSSDITLNDKELGPMLILLPAAFFALGEKGGDTEKPGNPDEQHRMQVEMMIRLPRTPDSLF